MIDWCVKCADMGCFMTRHKDMKHRLFTYSFMRIMKDALVANQESSYFNRLKRDDKWLDIFVLDAKFYKSFIQYEIPIGQIIGKCWFKKSYWSFMHHMIDEAYPEMRYWADYKMDVDVGEEGNVMFLFSKKK